MISICKRGALTLQNQEMFYHNDGTLIVVTHYLFDFYPFASDSLIKEQM